MHIGYTLLLRYTPHAMRLIQRDTYKQYNLALVRAVDYITAYSSDYTQLFFKLNKTRRGP